MFSLRRFTLPAVGTLLLPLAIAACDDGPGAPSESSGVSGGQVPTFEAFAQRAAASYCTHAVIPCCPTSRSKVPAECEASLRDDIDKEIGGEGGTYSPEGGARCLAAIDAMTCTSDDLLDRECRDIMRGADFHRKQGGETCMRESDCAAPAEGTASCDHGCDDGDASCVVGYCVASVDVGPGAKCDDGTEDKRVPLVYRCNRDSLCRSGICEGFPALGEACPNNYCRSGLVCNDAKICEAVAPGSCK